VTGRSKRVENLSPGEKRALLASLIQKKTSRSKLRPLSFGQERLWFVDQLDPGKPTYNMPAAFRLIGRIDVAIAERVVNEIVRRHEVLRTTFASKDGQPVQFIAPVLKLSLPVVDLRELAEAEREAEVRRLANAEARLSFDLSKGPLLRITLLRLGNEEHVFLVTMHHIISDGWSIGVFIREAVALYGAFSRGLPSPLPELPIQYADYAVWQREWLGGKALEDQLSYWRKQLADLPLLQLPTDYPRPPVWTYRGASKSLVLSKALSDSLKELGRRENATLFMILLAAFKTLLYRLTGQEDVVVGTPAAGRSRAEVESLIGFFVNALVLRSDASGDPSFRELLGRVREVCLAAYAHDGVPFEKLVQELNPDRSETHTPLFQVLFLMNYPADTSIDVPGMKVERLVVAEPVAKFDLEVSARQQDERIHLNLIYNTDFFSEARIAEMAAQFHRLLSQIVENPDQTIGSYSLLTAAARALLPDPTLRLNDAQEGTIHALFSHQARRVARRPVVVDAYEVWSYGELDNRSNQLANCLRAAGVQTEDLVAIYAHRSAPLICVLLGVLKAGAAIVILDPDYPAPRLIEYVRLAEPRAWIQMEAAGPLPDALEQFLASVTFCCRLSLPPGGRAAWDGLFAGSSVEAPDVTVKPEGLAYMAFTSGSTGTPKGVLCEHEPVTHFLPWQRDTFGLDESDRFSMLSGLSYNYLQREIFTPLLVGASVCIPDSESVVSGAKLADWMKQQAITVVHLTPAMGQFLAEARHGTTLSSLRYAFIGGDRVKKQDAGTIQKLAPQVTVVNLYGTTETQRASGYFVNTAGKETFPTDARREGWSGDDLPLGQGVRDVQLLVLNSSQQLAGVGELGEVYVRSPYLARGYKGDDRLTGERFTVSPFIKTRTDRLYRTGDLGSYLSDGNVRYAGRADEQVKIRGFRIGLREIEAVLGQHASVRETVVLAHEDAPGDPSASARTGKRLVAYVVSRQERAVTINELRDFLKERLPDYMVPSAFVLLDAMPLTPNGKVDRRALPAPADARPHLQASFVAARTPMEETLTGIWTQLLGVERVGIHDSFFDLGGHSLLVAQLVSRLEETYRVEVPLRKLFENPTVAGLAVALEDALRESFPAGNEAGLAVDLASEGVLDPAVCPATRSEAIRPDAATSVLLTGATGFLGAFLLHELLQQTPAKIYCLVRSPTVDDGKGRIQENLESYFLWDEHLGPRIVPVTGDLSKPFLGLGRERFDALADRIDAIYHSGALVNFFYPYAALKPANVGGTEEVLRLASHIKLKPLHYISSLTVFGAVDRADHRMIAETDSPDPGTKLGGGYAQSKWVAEKLVTIAGTRGIPVCIYRPGVIAGHSRTGVWNPNDLLIKVLKACFMLGCAPDLEMTVAVAPVDYVSRAIVYLSRQQDPIGKAFHLVNPHAIPLKEVFESFRSGGAPLRQLPFEEWRARLIDFVGKTGDDELRLLLMFFAGKTEELERPGGVDCQNVLKGLAGSSIVCPRLDAALFNTYASFFDRIVLQDVSTDGRQA
jgi:L-aminoadipate-semialdehyde dehydrogenase